MIGSRPRDGDDTRPASTEAVGEKPTRRRHVRAQSAFPSTLERHRPFALRRKQTLRTKGEGPILLYYLFIHNINYTHAHARARARMSLDYSEKKNQHTDTHTIQTHYNHKGVTKNSKAGKGFTHRVSRVYYTVSRCMYLYVQRSGVDGRKRKLTTSGSGQNFGNRYQ